MRGGEGAGGRRILHQNEAPIPLAQHDQIVQAIAWVHPAQATSRWQDLLQAVFDASYLELASRKKLPLACRDGPLREAAKRLRVKLL